MNETPCNPGMEISLRTSSDNGFWIGRVGSATIRDVVCRIAALLTMPDKVT